MTRFQQLNLGLAMTVNKCLLWHKYQLIKDNGFTAYSQCKDCGSRKAVQPMEGYQPINHDWLQGKSGAP